MAIQSGSPQPVVPGIHWLPRIGNAVADLLFPPRCVACHRLGAWLCAGCLSTVRLLRPPVCPACGWPVESAAPALCPHCRAHPSPIDGLRSCAAHGGALREAIHAFKYEGLTALAAPLGQLMARAWPALAGDCPLDLIVPVPLHAGRERERGYNQAALLARELGCGLGRPVAGHILWRSRATRPQVGLSAQERRLNVGGAFECAGQQAAGRRVLLVDDVCTTGATLEAAAEALRQAGACSVWAFTLARADKDFRPDSV